MDPRPILRIASTRQNTHSHWVDSPIARVPEDPRDLEEPIGRVDLSYPEIERIYGLIIHGLVLPSQGVMGYLKDVIL